MALCILDDVIRKTETACDRKCITLSRNTDQKAVGRAKRLNIKFTAGILNARCAEGVDFELAVMGRCHRPAFHIVEEIQHCDCEGSTLGRVSSGTKLIKEAERVAVGFSENIDDACHMSGECTQTLLNALLISDVGKYLIEDSKLGAVECRNVETRLSH